MGFGTYHIDEKQRLRARSYKLFSCSTQLSKKFIMLINVKMPTSVDILTFNNTINTSLDSLKARKKIFSVVSMSS